MLTTGNQDQRRTLKIGFSRIAPSKDPVGNISKKPKIPTKIPSVSPTFNLDGCGFYLFLTG
jgi:hypothetical protein